MSSISRDITEISRCAAQYRTERLAPLGLKSCHGSYLLVICDEPGISQDKLAQRICINKSNVARQVASLEEDGFITRTPSKEDRRVIMLFPTQKTLDVLPAIRKVLGDWRDFLTSDLTPEEQEQLLTMLHKLRQKAPNWTEAL